MINLNVATVSDQTGQYAGAIGVLPVILAGVAAELNSVIASANVTIDLNIVVVSGMGATATAGSPYHYTPNGTLQTLKNVVTTKVQTGSDINGGTADATITLSSSYMDTVNLYAANPADARAALVKTIMLHEVTHTLGMSGFLDRTTGALTTQYQSIYDANVVLSGGKPYFVGGNAVAVLGGAVPLTGLNSPSAIYHVDSTAMEYMARDLMGPTASFPAIESDLDLAILKDLGHSITKVLTSADGRTVVPGVLADTINGMTPMDTAYYSKTKASYDITAIGGGTAQVKTKAAPADADTLNAVERVKFADVTLAFDTQGHVGEVYRLYQAAFDRKPDLAGLGHWIKAREAGYSQDGVAYSFINSPEFQAMYGANPTNAEFVTRLYNNVLDRAPDAGGFAHWVGALNNKTLTREQVLISFSESIENKSRIILDADSSYAAAYRLYKAAFDRAPDMDGLVYWNTQIANGFSFGGVSHSFLASEEFTKLYGPNPSNEQFVTLLYNNVLDRAPDAAGKAHWMQQLNSGTLSRADVLLSFSESTENRANLIGVMQDYVEFIA